jgi:hypothetical protein
MNSLISTSTLVGMLAMAPLVHAEQITDSYATGNKLTASMLDNLRSAVNNNHLRVALLEGGPTGIEINVDCAADSTALINTNLLPGITNVLIGMCDGPGISRSLPVVSLIKETTSEYAPTTACWAMTISASGRCRMSV